MKTRNRSGLITVLAASFGLVAALFAGGCAESDDTDGAGGPSDQVVLAEGGEGDGEAVDHVDLLTHPLNCGCPICTSRQAGAVR
jgi:hypothetical protein